MKKDEKEQPYDFVIELTKIKDMATKLETEIKSDTNSSLEYLQWVDNIGEQAAEMRKAIEVYEQKYLE
jgi:hypothetical protein